MKMKNMTLENIAKACNGEYIGDESLKDNFQGNCCSRLE